MPLRAIQYSAPPRGGAPAPASILERRQAMDHGAATPEGVAVIPEAAGPGRSEWVMPAGHDGRAALLFLHGSGYSKGSPRSHRALVADIVRATGVRALAVDYRLTPEHPFPAAVEDALAAYRLLLAQAEPDQIVCIGDSAGGGLALAMLLAASDLGLPMPAACVTLSAWTDLTVTGPSTTDGTIDDPLVTAEMLLSAADLYLAGADPSCPYASPLYGDLAGLPPLLMQVGGREIMIDDTRRLARKAEAAGVSVEIQIFEGMSHVFQLRDPDRAESRRAIAAIAGFIRGHVSLCQTTGASVPLQNDEIKFPRESLG